MFHYFERTGDLGEGALLIDLSGDHARQGRCLCVMTRLPKGVGCERRTAPECPRELARSRSDESQAWALGL